MPKPRKETEVVLRKWKKKKEGNKRAKAQRKVGKASPALKKMGLCPKEKRF